MVRRSQDAGSTKNDASGTDHRSSTSAPSMRAVVGALAGMAAAWIAADSTGFLAHPLRHALTWLALVVVLVAAWPQRQRTWKELLSLAAAVVVAIAMTATSRPVCNLLAVTLVLGMLARVQRGVDRQVLLVTSFATAVLGIYRLACTSIPTVWWIADLAGLAIGRLAGAVVGKPLWVGATFGGLDFLVLMAVLLIGWLNCTPPPRLARAVYAVVAIVCGHLVYLTVLAYSTDLVAKLPEPPPPPPLQRNLYVPPDWHWSEGVAGLVPWNVPLLAGVLQLAIAAMMFRWAAWSPAKDDQSKPAGSPSGIQTAIELGPLILAVLIPVVTTVSLYSSNLAGKKIVAYAEGYLDWERPVHNSYGQASAGMCGMLPTFVNSLAGTFVRSSDLSQEDLADADVLLLIHPVGAALEHGERWPQDRLERVWDYVRAGGSLLLVAEPSVQEEGLASAFEEVLGPTAMEVGFDTAIPKADYWQHAQQVIAHPATTGIGDQRNRFGMVMASSIRAPWPARPLLVGRWGWSDPGSDAVMTEVYRYDAGEKLGDLVLAAEQSVGDGTVVVLGDTTSLTNEGYPHCYLFTGRLLAYLARRPSSPQAPWRQALALAGCLALIGLLAWRPDPTQLAAVAVLLALTTAVSTAVSYFQSQVLPDGRKISPDYRIAYIDASHVEAYNDFGWVYEGIAGLQLTLMRNGYLPLMLTEVTGHRLKHAELLISIAPARRFSRAEREAVRSFVQSGGIFLCTAGAEHAGPINPLLSDFGFRVPCSPVRPGQKTEDAAEADQDAEEPAPMGHLRSTYRGAEDYETYVMFYAGWPIELPAGHAEVLVRDFEGLPVIAVRRIGRGKVVVVGDTAFAMNKNLEYVGGQPFGGDYENAYFWRWLIAYLTDRPEWVPPKAKVDFSEEPESGQAAEPEPAAGNDSEKASNGEVAP